MAVVRLSECCRTTEGGGKPMSCVALAEDWCGRRWGEDPNWMSVMGN